ncbi:acetylserotonin O-methyltransferase-like [Rhineura floridana]|uniref:acetylserotonin O-methyltransferase-like n=1 Tax=Rhineura floridana TaxID=261503 RepID=UPI002AC877DB|nr:acetylserotonin O-methyltransferase-like [Rhineura floridana]
MDSTEDMESIRTFLQYQHGCLISKIIFTACELGVFDLLLESGELMTAATIAEHLGTSNTGMERLLEACVGLKLLQVERKGNPALYGNTDFSSVYLAESSPKSQYHYMMFCSGTTFPNLAYLADAVRERKNQIERIFDNPPDDFFEALFRSEEKLKRFLNMMNSTRHLCGKDVVAAFDLSHFPLICDLGGSGGGLAKECISLHPNSTVTILDLPKVVEMAKKHFVSLEEQRISFHEGDFFKDPIPEADLYILARILHDWGDEECVQLLTKLQKACKPGGGVLVVEVVLNEDRSGPLEAHLYSLLMLLHTEGKERTPSEYNVLLSLAGFKEIQLKKRKFYDAILGRK